MPNQILTLEEANLFCGAAPQDSSASNHLTLTEVKLPSMDEQNVDHRPGGSELAIEIEVIFLRLQCTFLLVGWTPQVENLIAAWTQSSNTFTFYGVLRDQHTGTPYRALALMRGRLGLAEPLNWRRGDIHHWQYAIRNILHYELTVDNKPIYKWDFFTNTLEVGGVSRTAAGSGLRLGTATPAAPLPVTPTVSA